MKNKELVAIAETFADYEFKNGEKGLYYRCIGRTGRIAFAKGYATYCLKQGWMHRQKMGYIAIEEHIPNKKAFKKQRNDQSLRKMIFHKLHKNAGKLDFIRGILKGMELVGGFLFCMDFCRAGLPIDLILRKQGYVRIRLLSVKKEFQGKGYMRKLVQMAYDRSDLYGVPCIVSTDSFEKAAKYEHLGFRLFQKRRLSGNATEYDMIRLPEMRY